jgi:hypothetical protein
MKEIRETLLADLRGQCPYGEPPVVESTDGEEPDALKGNWRIGGEPRNVLDPLCQWIVARPDACAECALNPRNRRAPSARLSYLLHIERLQVAGATFHYRDLAPEDWRDLLALKAERHRIERERWKRDAK